MIYQNLLVQRRVEMHGRVALALEHLCADGAETLHDLIHPMVYAEAVALFDKHRADGLDVVIVSSSGEEVVGPIGDMLGVDHVIATRMVVQDGRYTGEIAFYAYGEGKATAIRALADAPTLPGRAPDLVFFDLWGIAFIHYPPAWGWVPLAAAAALLAAAGGHEHQATDHLENALATAAPWTLRRPFLAEAGVLRPLPERRIETGTAVPGFALELLEQTSDESGADTEARRTFIDPLTERERTVLRYLPAPCRMRRSPPSCTCR